MFWLSGLCESKQFPLTGGAGSLIEPFNGPTRFITTVTPNVEIQRDVFFDFQNSQLVYGVTADSTASLDGTETTVQRDAATTAVEFFDLDSFPAGTAWVVAGYRQPNGSTSGDILYRYRDAA